MPLQPVEVRVASDNESQGLKERQSGRAAQTGSAKVNKPATFDLQSAEAIRNIAKKQREHGMRKGQKGEARDREKEQTNKKGRNLAKEQNKKHASDGNARCKRYTTTLTNQPKIPHLTYSLSYFPLSMLNSLDPDEGTFTQTN